MVATTLNMYVHLRYKQYRSNSTREQWDTIHNVSISSLADGIEETSVQGLISPLTGPSLISALGDIQGLAIFV
jgi:hypothetical protein